MGTRFAPKTWVLTKEETPSSFETWKENLLFNLTIDGSFSEFLAEDFKWSPPSVLNRGLVDDTTQGQNSRTAAQKVAYLNLMLGSIAGYAPIIRRTFFTQDACSLHDIWSRLRTYYHFRKTGALILDYESITLEAGETYESFWERLSCFIDDNLLNPNDHINHLGVEVIAQEKLSPTLLNLTVVHWLKCIHVGLPALVKQRYATELRNTTVASLRDEISESLDSLVAELNGESASVSRSSYQKPKYKNSKSSIKTNKNCILCQTAKRPSNHFLSKCPYLPEGDKRFISRARLVDVTDDEEELEPAMQAIEIVNDESNIRRVDIESSPILHVKCGTVSVPVVIDSGAESNLIEESFAKSTGATILKTNTNANQADGQSRLEIVGEVHLEFQRYPHTFKFNGLVARKLKDKVIAGMPFLSTNDIFIRPSKKQIHISDKEIVYYETRRIKSATNRRSTAVILRVPQQTTLLPGDSLSVPLPNEFTSEHYIAVEPRMNSPSLQTEKFGNIWLKPQIVNATDGVIDIANRSEQPILLKKHEQIGNLMPVEEVDEFNVPLFTEKNHPLVRRNKIVSDIAEYETISVDPGNVLSATHKENFKAIHKEHKSTFDSKELGCYNGASGPLEVKINMGPSLPPQRKGKMPLYNRALQEEQQQICDDLEGSVFARPEDLGITVEYLNPSFLVRKPSGKKRLVTAFGEVGQYSKPQPALMPNVDQILRTISEWKYIIKTDLTSAYWQMPLSKESMKFCGIVTPFKGVRVYQRGAMGMPGTETALEEMMCRILGDLITEGSVTKIADDLYVGGPTPDDVINAWRKVLSALSRNGLKLCAAKTVCCPQSVTILGWLWCNGTLQASPHRLSALEAADLPKTVGQLRSYIGSYKFLSRVISNYSDLLSPLDEIVAGRKSSEKVVWNDTLVNAFKKSQKQLSSAKIIKLPRREDQLQIITDASQYGIAATLYVIRGGKPHVAGFYNAKLRPHQVRWLPCEIEALCIGAAVSHFKAEIIENQNQVIVLTDSRPCVMAYEKLCRGEFSNSARVSTFLSIVSRFHVKLDHIKGYDNIVSDYASRNPPLQCTEPSCQICKFIQEVEDSVVRSCTVKEILNATSSVPFSSRSGWHEMQQSCKHLRRTTAHLKQGTIPSKKETTIKDIKRYLQVAKISRDDLLVVASRAPLQLSKELIIVPRVYVHGLLVCLHLRLQHPSKNQMKQVFNRAFYCLDLDQAIDELIKGCHTCVSLQKMHNRFIEQSTSKPLFVGSHLNADVLKRSGQCIVVIRENASSFTFAQLVPDEKASTLKRTLILMLLEIRSKGGPVIWY